MFTLLCNHYHYLIPEYFHYPKRNPCPLAITSQPLETSNLSVSIDFPVWDISHEWYHIIYMIFCNWLISLRIMFSGSINIVLRISTSFHFMAEQYCIVWTYHPLSIHSPADGHLGCFHFLASEQCHMNFPVSHVVLSQSLS